MKSILQELKNQLHDLMYCELVLMLLLDFQ